MTLNLVKKFKEHLMKRDSLIIEGEKPVFILYIADVFVKLAFNLNVPDVRRIAPVNCAPTPHAFGQVTFLAQILSAIHGFILWDWTVGNLDLSEAVSVRVPSQPVDGNTLVEQAMEVVAV